MLLTLSACSLFGYTPTELPARPPPEPPSRSATAPAQQERHGGALKRRPARRPATCRPARPWRRSRSAAGWWPGCPPTPTCWAPNPLTGQIEGFDIDLVKAVAKAIFGDENRYQLRVITAAQRIPTLQEGEVDLVARNMTITCDRWTQIAFSSEYYRSTEDPGPRLQRHLAGRPEEGVCAAATSSLENLKKLAPEAVPVEADNHTGCLVLFQQSEVAAITGDDTVLAGLAAQDLYAVVPDQRAFTAEPYGLGLPAKNVDFVRFVNARLAQMRSNGEWTAIYNRWLADSRTGPSPPKGVYGRTS